MPATHVGRGVLVCCLSIVAVTGWSLRPAGGTDAARDGAPQAEVLVDAAGQPARPVAGADALAFYRAHWGARGNDWPVSACFAEGTPADVVHFVSANLGYETGEEPGARFNLGNRWPGTLGDPTTLTWSFVPDGTVISSGIGEGSAPSNLFETLDSHFAEHGGRAAWIYRFQQVFDRWSALTGLSYQRVTFNGEEWDDGAVWGTDAEPGLRGDVRISMKFIDGGSNVLAYNFFPTFGDMVLDSAENWSATSSNNRFMRNIIAHEHGHGLGFFHVCPITGGKLMEPFLNTSFDHAQHDDIRAAHRAYGDQYEPNNAFVEATEIGTVEVGAPLTPGAIPPPTAGVNPPFSSILSLDEDGEQDYFRFSVNGARNVTVVCAPVGLTYDSSIQSGACGGSGDCCSGNNVNSLTMTNLVVQVWTADGVTMLATAFGAPAGVAETANAVLPAAGEYAIRVFETNSPTQPQLYTLTVTASCPASAPSVNPLPAQTAACGAPFASVAPTGTGGEAFTYSLVDAPEGATIDPQTGIVTWTPSAASGSPQTITIQGSGPCGVSEQSFDVSVTPGDFDGDGLLNAADVGAFVDHLLGLSVSQACAADVDLSGEVDADDVAVWVGAAAF